LALLTDRIDLGEFSRELKTFRPDFLVLHSRHDNQVINLARKHFPESQIGSLLAYEFSDVEIEEVLKLESDFFVCDWLAGGTGNVFDRRVLDFITITKPDAKLMIAGGINTLNVEELVRDYQPFAIDVDSGVREGQFSQFSEGKLRVFSKRIKFANSREDDTRGFTFPRVSNAPWSSFRSSTLDQENVVAKLRLLSKLDAVDRYRNATESLTQRVSKSLSQLSDHPDVPDRWVEAALCAFAATTYLPNELLKSSIRYLYMRVWKTVTEFENPNTAFHVFSNDPGALAEDFFRINEIHGRLDQDKYVRIAGVEELGRALADASKSDSLLHKQAIQRLLMLTERKVWVVLVDQTLSGHSLVGDLERIAWFNQSARIETGESAQIVVCAQIATKTALSALKKSPKLIPLFEDGTLRIEHAIGLGNEHNVADHRCSLISTPSILRDLRDLSKWFSSEFIEGDKSLDRMRRKSRDNLHLGYRKAGLLLARQDNCPTDSLPILWYRGTGKQGFEYSGPFPRVHSRIGEQTIEDTSDLWSLLTKATDKTWLTNMGADN
jgi:phosphoribosylanthranilate isomerase